MSRNTSHSSSETFRPHQIAPEVERDTASLLSSTYYTSADPIAHSSTHDLVPGLSAISHQSVLKFVGGHFENSDYNNPMSTMDTLKFRSRPSSPGDKSCHAVIPDERSEDEGYDGDKESVPNHKSLAKKKKNVSSTDMTKSMASSNGKTSHALCKESKMNEPKTSTSMPGR